jgi:hypothetical protein
LEDEMVVGDMVAEVEIPGLREGILKMLNFR